MEKIIDQIKIALDEINKKGKNEQISTKEQEILFLAALLNEDAP